MSLAAAWLSYQKLSERRISEWRSHGFLQKPSACKIGPNQNDDHAFGGGMGWLSKTSDLKISEWRSYGFLQKPIARKIGPNQNDDHVFGGGMGWLPKTFGSERCYMALLWIPAKTDRLQYRPKPER